MGSRGKWLVTAYVVAPFLGLCGIVCFMSEPSFAYGFFAGLSLGLLSVIGVCVFVLEQALNFSNRLERLRTEMHGFERRMYEQGKRQNLAGYHALRSVSLGN